MRGGRRSVRGKQTNPGRFMKDKNRQCFAQQLAFASPSDDSRKMVAMALLLRNVHACDHLPILPRPVCDCVELSPF